MCRYHRYRAAAGIGVAVVSATVLLEQQHLPAAKPWVPELCILTASGLVFGMVFIIMVLSLHHGSGAAGHMMRHPQHKEDSITPEQRPAWPHGDRYRARSAENPGHEDIT